MTKTAPTTSTQAEAITTIASAMAVDIPQSRGVEKKTRQAVRRRFASATNSLVIEAATLLGLVKRSWKLGETQFISVDLRAFNPEAFASSEELGLFLGLKDRFAAAGVTANTVAFSSAGHVSVWGHALDRKEA